MAIGILLDMEGQVVMSGRDLKKLRLIEELQKKTKTQAEVAEELELSVRQVRRLVRKAERDGVKGIVHGLKGKPGNRAMAEDLKAQVLNIWQNKYRSARLNFSHFTEKLNEVADAKICRESVRCILLGNGVAERAL